MSIDGGGWKWATCPSAWTPASVLPEPWTEIGCLTISEMAAWRMSWTVFLLGCDCQPEKGLPS